MGRPWASGQGAAADTALTLTALALAVALPLLRDTRTARTTAAGHPARGRRARTLAPAWFFPAVNTHG
ncbi:hypothetical protein [Streptomyces sp. NPDC002537]